MKHKKSGGESANNPAMPTFYQQRTAHGTTNMLRRAGFTITEMLVSMALIMFIMLVLSEAFIAGLDSFTQLKAVGDMETKLRTSATMLRRDLQAAHFGNKSAQPMRLNNFDGSTDYGGGFFAASITYNWVGVNITTHSSTQPWTVTLSAPPPQSLQPGMAVKVSNADSPPKEAVLYVDNSYVPGKNPVVLTNPIPATVTTPSKMQWPTFPAPEGGGTAGIPDADGVYSYGGPGDTSYALHFTVNLSSKAYGAENVSLQRRENYFTAALPPLPANPSPTDTLYQQSMQLLYRSTIPTDASGNAITPPVNLGQPPFYDISNYYTPYAEVAYFLRDSGQKMPDQTPLFNLHRRQLAVLDSSGNDLTSMNQFNAFPPQNTSHAAPGGTTVNANIPVANSKFYDFSWIPVADAAAGPFYMHFNSMQDLVHPWNRSLSYGVYNGAGSPISGYQFPYSASNWLTYPTLAKPSQMPRIGDRGEPPNLQGADLLLTDVVSMTIRVRRLYGNTMDPDFVFVGFDTSPDVGVPFRVQAIEVILRIWDRKTNKTRQLTIVQNM